MSQYQSSETMRPLIIAHRGASGFLPEHTLESKALAFGLGADYLEQDVVLTKDDVPIVLHDLYLDTVTDVAERYPNRSRSNGRFYAIDFTLEEIRHLTVSERFHHETGRAVFPNRFPPHTGRFRIPTLEEEIAFIQGLNKSSGRTAGIYPEIKQPIFHEVERRDITRIVWDVLQRHGYLTAESPCFVQCFHPPTLKRLKNELRSPLKQIQLLEYRDCESLIENPERLKEFFDEVAIYAQGVGPDLSLIFPPSLNAPHSTSSASPRQSRFVELAHAAGLAVHPWTLRRDSLPTPFPSFQQLHEALKQSGVDGVFSDFPGESLQLFSSMSS